MAKASKLGIFVPSLLYVSKETSSIYMEKVEGITVKDFFNSSMNADSSKVEIISRKIGEILWTMHSSGIIHGDLTTSNMIYQNGGEIVSILILIYISA